jgi:hypothetical protein
VTYCAGREPLRRCPANEPGAMVVCVYVAGDLATYVYDPERSADHRLMQAIPRMPYALFLQSPCVYACGDREYVSTRPRTAGGLGSRDDAIEQKSAKCE